MDGLTQTGASPSELIALERRIADRGLQLRRLPPNVPPGTPAVKPEPLSAYEEAVVRCALLSMAQRLSNDPWRREDV